MMKEEANRSPRSAEGARGIEDSQVSNRKRLRSCKANSYYTPTKSVASSTNTFVLRSQTAILYHNGESDGTSCEGILTE